MTSRRAFLSANIRREDGKTARPPGSVMQGFTDLCTKCGACSDACPEDVVAVDPDGYPVFRPGDNACTFCGDCAQSCPTPALDIGRLADWPWRATMKTESCLSMNGISCRVCQDNCEQNAIRFKLKTGGRAEPTLDAESCNGCGICPTLCPADAIALERQSQPQTEAIQ
ncbi:ferredoxin-type protein NapF [Ruegeria sp. Ofav3-42]|uniref:ferredoxin-type protein NapF n=1 Tax=Ruegeria sp. Ofav3-42 TaxID=2917759 RepID=UPI001EF5AF46|nr:ferredoxin-type protein NapF [Ruegeria sp. Ofav3-42]MCG7519982.1 ferredoxin-type protein NapF [Ruegeria sp. Ofav3-42]